MKKSPFLKKFVQAVIITGFLVFAIPLTIGFYLSPRDALGKADVIVVLSGGETEARVKEGIWLYKEKYAPKIIFSGAAKEGSVSNALSMKKIALDQGIPEQDIILEENSKDTNENAKFTAEILKKESYGKIILTTSPYHQRRAYKNFSKYLPGNEVIINWPAKDSTWRKFGWWNKEESIQLTLSELAKNIYTSAKE
ncbi:MAG: YdcF family protein [Patescibacteria group bacterium]|nr:YdcF family protein [Patescibacteria group bacterium]